MPSRPAASISSPTRGSSPRSRHGCATSSKIACPPTFRGPSPALENPHEAQVESAQSHLTEKETTMGQVKDLVNRQVRLGARPMGLPKPSDWKFTEEAVQEPAEGELLVEVSHISLDPAMRGWMNDAKSYIRPVAIDEVMRAGAAGKVLASRHPGFKEGDLVAGSSGVQKFAISDGKGVRKVVARFAMHARIVMCGAISQYNNTTPVKGPANYLSLLVNRASMTGMVVFDYADRYGEAAREMAQWIAAGKLIAKEDVVAGGIDAFPDTLLRLFKGENFGKLVLAL